MFLESGSGFYLTVQVRPGAPHSKVVGVHGDAVKVWVKAPAQDGRANQAVIRLIAESLGSSRDAVTIVAGLSSRRKRLHIAGVTGEQMESFLAGLV